MLPTRHCRKEKKKKIISTRKENKEKRVATVVTALICTQLGPLFSAISGKVGAASRCPFCVSSHQRFNVLPRSPSPFTTYLTDPPPPPLLNRFAFRSGRSQQSKKIVIIIYSIPMRLLSALLPMSGRRRQLFFTASFSPSTTCSSRLRRPAPEILQTLSAFPPGARSDTV